MGGGIAPRQSDTKYKEGGGKAQIGFAKREDSAVEGGLRHRRVRLEGGGFDD